MRRLIVQMSMSLDGFVAGPAGETDWQLRSRGEAGRTWIKDKLHQAGLLVMGRKTYLTMAAHWPNDTSPLAAPMNALPKAVFTRQPSWKPEGAGTDEGSESWAGAHVVHGDLATEIARLKQQPGNEILAFGGVNFAQSLAASGLVDEYRLLVHPVALGQGLSLFGQLPAAQPLDLRGTTLFPSGVAAHIYWPAAG